LHVFAVPAELQVDGLHQRQVTGQQGQLFLSSHGVFACNPLRDAKWSRQLQDQAAALVERRGDVLLQDLKPTLAAYRGAPEWIELRAGAEGESGGHGKYLRPESQQTFDSSAHELHLF